MEILRFPQKPAGIRRSRLTEELAEIAAAYAGIEDEGVKNMFRGAFGLPRWGEIIDFSKHIENGTKS
ncbi:MAG: hypothetical protein EOM66_10755 [Clostridia bacterium]|nr:hypothetical protein [Clostridia bacterium]